MTTITNYVINAQGLARIKAFLTENHKLGGDHFDDDMLRAWASSAEEAVQNDLTPSIEIAAHDTIMSQTVVLYLDAADFDAREEEID